MSNTQQYKIGSVGWMDLTVPNALEVKEFYEAVVGWKSQNLSMGDYDDYVMLNPQSGESVAGVCHARGINSDIPPQWVLYFIVEDISASLKQVKERGGKQLTEVREYSGGAMYCFIADPAGATCALFQPGGEVK